MDNAFNNSMIRHYTYEFEDHDTAQPKSRHYLSGL